MDTENNTPQIDFFWNVANKLFELQSEFEILHCNLDFYIQREDKQPAPSSPSFNNLKKAPAKIGFIPIPKQDPHYNASDISSDILEKISELQNTMVSELKKHFPDHSQCEEIEAFFRNNPMESQG